VYGLPNEIPDLKMLSGDQQLRDDSADGSPSESLFACSGPDDGQRHCATAGQQHACTGLDPPFDYLPMWTHPIQDGSESERECLADMAVPPCVNQQMPVEGSRLVDGSSTPQKPVATTMAAGTLPAQASAERRADGNRTSGVWEQVTDALERMIPKRLPKIVSNIVTIRMVLPAPSTPSPSNNHEHSLESYDRDKLFSLSGLHDVDCSCITHVTCRPLTEVLTEYEKRNHAAKLLPRHITHCVTITVEAQDVKKARSVVESIAKALYEEVFKKIEFRFEELTCTGQWKLTSCAGSETKTEEKYMRDFVKLVIAFKTTDSGVSKTTASNPAACTMRRAHENDIPRRYHFISCVHTQVPMVTCLFVLICLHVTKMGSRMTRRHLHVTQ
jgi:hypothetical protein